MNLLCQAADFLERDFPNDTLTIARLRQELADYKGRCHYDHELKKIVYKSDADAFHAYMTLHRRVLEEHRLAAERNKSFCIDTAVELEWIRKNAPLISDFWKRTHVFVAPEVLEYIACQGEGEDF